MLNEFMIYVKVMLEYEKSVKHFMKTNIFWRVLWDLILMENPPYIIFDIRKVFWGKKSFGSFLHFDRFWKINESCIRYTQNKIRLLRILKK